MKFENPFGSKNKNEKEGAKRAGANTARMFAATLAAMNPLGAAEAGTAQETTGQTAVEMLFNNPETIVTQEGIELVQAISQMKFPETKDPSSMAAALNLSIKERLVQDYMAIVERYIQAHPADGAYDPARELQHIAMLAQVGSTKIRWADARFQSYVIMDLQERFAKVAE